MSARDHLIVKILPRDEWKTPGPAQYSTNNGLTMTDFQPGGVHSVPDYVAWGMERRGWCKIIREDEVETQDTVDTEIQMSDLRKKED